jgi:hypothetical protein
MKKFALFAFDLTVTTTLWGNLATRIANTSFTETALPIG